MADEVLLEFWVYGGGGALVIWFCWWVIKTGMDQKRNYDQLIASGFQEKYVLRGSSIFTFDTTNREFAVVYSNGVFRYPFDTIESWNHICDVKNGRQRNHRFVVNVLDPDQPRHETQTSLANCNHWLSKMSALLAN